MNYATLRAAAWQMIREADRDALSVDVTSAVNAMSWYAKGLRAMWALVEKHNRLKRGHYV